MVLRHFSKSITCENGLEKSRRYSLEKANIVKFEHDSHEFAYQNIWVKLMDLIIVIYRLNLIYFNANSIGW